MARLLFPFLFAGVMICPAQLPSSFPQQPTLFGEMLNEPHDFVVKEITQKAPGYSFRIEKENGSAMTISQTGSAETPESRFVTQLSVGGRYRMPDCVLHYLGVNEAAQIIHALPGKPLSGLKGMRPFPARVLDQGMGESTYSIIIQETGGRIHHLKGAMEDRETRAVAAYLTRDCRLEFPAALEDALRTKEQREERAKPKNDATAVLKRYLGEWSGVLDANPTVIVNMKCHWRPDGSGIWREIIFTDQTSYNDRLFGGSWQQPDIVIMEYDRTEGIYLARSMEANGIEPLKSTWNEKTRTFTTMLPVDGRGLKRVNEATFTREDRIDWKTTIRSLNNEILQTTGGHYDRVSGPDTVDKATPPPTRISDGSETIVLPPLPELPKITIEGLASDPPFRAKVTSVSVKPDEVKLGLLLSFGHRLELNDGSRGIGESATGKALGVLKPGTIYEFPHCILHPDAKPANGPATPEMMALEPFIGEWKVRVRDKQGNLQDRTIQIRYYWSANGAALWQELAHPYFSLLGYISHDAASVRYTMIKEHALQHDSQSNARWDAATRTYTLKRAIGELPPSAVRETVETFKTDDLIEWSSKQMNTDGTVVNESSGTYERIKP